MKKRWLFFLISVFLVMILAACTQPNGSGSPPDQDKPAPEVEQDAGADQEDEMADEGEDSGTDHDDSDMVDEGEDSDTEHDDSDMAEEEEAEDDTAEDTAPVIDAEALYAGNCARCHGADRSGDRAPALLPGRLTKDATVYVNTIINGPGPMPAFGGKLSAEEIDALVEFILSDPQ